MLTGSYLDLACAAIEGRTPSLHGALDGTAAAKRAARVALAVIDRKGMLEITE
jgi:hypothetical protein